MIKILTNEKFYLPVFYIAMGWFVYTCIKIIIRRISKMHIHGVKDKRKNTIVSLINNIIKYVIAVLVVLAILNQLGFDTTGILASIGVAGVIIGLALQDVVADFLAGISIVFDNHYTVGDFIEINGFKGEVIALGLQTTKIKSMTGEVKIISNSDFKEVINYSIYNKTQYLDIYISYDTDLKKLEKVLNDIKPTIENIKGVIGNIELLGLDSFEDSSLVYKISVTSKYSDHFRIKREINKLIKETFEKSNIEIPYNKLDLYLKKED